MDPIEQLFEEATNIINQELGECDDQIDTLERELEDVLQEVDTPDSSDDEDERQVRLHRERNQIMREFKSVVLSVDYQPTEQCSFFDLYENPQYRRKMLQKLRKVKRIVKRADVERVLNNPRYLNELRRIQNTYPSHGGRAMLNELIAIYVTLYYEEN